MKTLAPSEGQTTIDDCIAYSRSISRIVDYDTKEEAIKRSYDNANDPWKVAAIEELWSISKRKATLTADDLWIAMEGRSEKTNEPSALGGVMRAAQKIGFIRPTRELVRTKLPQRHRDVRVWESLVFVPSS